MNVFLFILQEALTMIYRYCFIILSLVITIIPNVLAQEPDVEQWWPSIWGANDTRGAMNRLDANNVITASKLIRQGKVYELGRIYEADMPLFGNRHFKLTIPGAPTHGPDGKNQLVGNDEMVSGEIGQVGTQFDGFAHIGTRINGEDRYYNGLTGSEIYTPYGFKKLGVENVGTFFTRGILLDVAAYKNVERLQPGYIISIDDVKGTLAKQNIEISEGDVVLFHTGHGKLWKTDNEAYSGAEPGPGVTTLKWLIEQGIVMTGADNYGVEAVPGENKDNVFEGHQVLMNYNGVHNIENLNLEELASDKVYEFAFIYAPLKLKGATGSPGNPIAVN
jgi:kynurenine formamidase